MTTTATPAQQALRLRYTPQPPALPAVLKEVHDLAAFVRYYELLPDFFREDVEQCFQLRMSLYTAHAGGSMTEDIQALLSGENLPETHTGQHLLNLYHLLNYLETNTAEPVTLDSLRHMHTQLAIRMPHYSNAGRLRDELHDSFTDIYDPNLPHGEELRALLADALRMVQDGSVHVLVRAFLFYYVCSAIQPFGQDNEEIAMLACRQIMLREGYGLQQLIDLERDIFYNKNFRSSTAEYWATPDFRMRLAMDLNPYLDACLLAYAQSVQEVKRITTQKARMQLGYSQLTPRQKNRMNFWLEKGFYIHQDKLPQLSARQQEILQMLIRQGDMMNKDLVPVFMVDRKTIQRDFNGLIDMAIAEQRGLGRNLRYYLDIRFIL